MNCKDVKDSLWEYQHGRLSDVVRLGVAEHLRSCSPCSLQFQQLQQVEIELDRLDEIEPSPYFDQRLNGRLDELVKPNATWSRLWFWPQDRYALTFVLLLLVTLGTWVGFRYQQAQKLKSMKDILELQERYLGKSEGTVTKTEEGSSVRAAQSLPGGHVRTKTSPEEEESIPDADLAVLENYELLQDYDFLKNFDIADSHNEGARTNNPN